MNRQLQNLSNMRARLNFRGGAAQQDRMIKDKKRTLDRVVKYSYQGAKLKKINSNSLFAGLINPNKLKPDYDDKIVSIDFDAGFAPGTVFEWTNTGTTWLVYLQDLTELAYFKGDIRRCRYYISWEDENDVVHGTYAAIKGPAETRINYIQKSGISVDTPNLSLHLMMPQTKETLEYFKRYSKFYLKGISEFDEQICWRVEAKDSISMPGILEIVAVEYYANEIEDDIEAGVVGGLVASTIEPENNGSEIEGETFIKPLNSYTFTYKGFENAEWKISNNVPIAIESINGKTITVMWEDTYDGQFELSYGITTKTVVVEPLF